MEGAVYQQYYKAVGFDKSGVKRVFATGGHEKTAVFNCWKEVGKYLQHRPDCGPKSNWTVKVEFVNDK